jgi:PKD domain-containing protein
MYTGVMNVRIVPLSIALCLLIVFSVTAEETALPVVQQPQEWVADTQVELTSYLEELRLLADTLADEVFASRRTHAVKGWTAWLSEEFCVYVRGLLSERGYDVVIVQSDDSAENPTTWLLVAITLSDTFMAWIPVDASPALGEKQETLGQIALADGYTVENPLYATAHMTYDRVLELSSNEPPVLLIGKRLTDPKADTRESFHPSRAYDPDGSIVLYIWDFGDGVVEGTTSKYIWHRYQAGGNYMMTLTAIDNQGGIAVDSISVHVDRGICSTCGS